MPKFVFIAPATGGGVRSFISNIAGFLKKEGVDYSILFYATHEGLGTSVRVEEEGRVKTVEYSKHAAQRSVFRTLTSFLAPDDVLICNDLLEIDAVNYRRLPNRILYILHGDLEHYNSILSKHSAIIDQVGCVSIGLRDKYSKRYPSLPFSVCHPLVPNFKGPRKFSEGAIARGLFVGRFEYLKGADVFIEVVQETLQKGWPIHWTVLAARKGSDSALLDRLPSAVDICFDMPYAAVLEKMEESDLLVFPSRSEGFGMVVLEGMKRGVVPIARPLPIGIPDMVQEGGIGYLANSAGEIVTVIGMLNADRRRLVQEQLACLRFANEEFDYNLKGKAFHEILVQLSMRPIPTGKTYSNIDESLSERMLPGWLFQSVKYLYRRIVYRNRY